MSTPVPFVPGQEIVNGDPDKFNPSTHVVMPHSPIPAYTPPTPDSVSTNGEQSASE